MKSIQGYKRWLTTCSALLAFALSNTLLVAPAIASDPGLAGFEQCLIKFDGQAKAKKLSPDNYKAAIA